MIRTCRIWLFGVVVVALAAGTTLMLAARAEDRGEADSLLSALLTTPAEPMPPGPQPSATAADLNGTVDPRLAARTNAELAMAQAKTNSQRAGR
jgi:hypothetical protein